MPHLGTKSKAALIAALLDGLLHRLCEFERRDIPHRDLSDLGFGGPGQHVIKRGKGGVDHLQGDHAVPHRNNPELQASVDEDRALSRQFPALRVFRHSESLSHA
jgi:hypothetical protein